MLSQYLTKSKSKNPSGYTPSKEVLELTQCHQKDYQKADDLRHRSFRHFNDMSVISRADIDQRTFNVYEDPPSEDPDEAWKWPGRRPTSRNKVISISAHLISSMMYPRVTAQNDRDEVDRGASEVFEAMVAWNIDNSDYDISMLFGVIAACVNPCAYMGVEYAEGMQTIREQQENGEVSLKEVIDTVISGIQVEPIPMDEILISNFFQYAHQRQPYRIRRRYISMSDFEARYGDHDNCRFVEPGIQHVWDSDSKMFYEAEETEKTDLVEEMVIACRSKDLEVPYVNGIYMGTENTEANRFKHRDNEGRPRYPEAKLGYEPIDEKRFYYYKSLVFKLWPDQKRLDRLHRIFVDGATLDAVPAGITTGAPKVDASVNFPGAVTAFPKDATYVPLDTGRNLSNLFANLNEAEKSIGESSQSEVRSGALAPGDKTRYEIAKAEQNSIVKEFAIFGRMWSTAVENVGELMVDDIIRFQTVNDAEEITDGMFRLKDRSYTLPDQTVGGKKMTKKVVFTDEYMGRKMTKGELLADSYKLLEEAEETGVMLYKANPDLCSRLKYKVNIDADAVMPKSQTFKEERNLRAYQLMSADPFADREAVSRDYLFDPLTDGNSDKYMRKAESLGIMPGSTGEKTDMGGKPMADADIISANQNTNVS